MIPPAGEKEDRHHRPSPPAPVPEDKKDGDCDWVDFSALRDMLAMAVCNSSWPCNSVAPGGAGNNGGV